MSENSGLNGRDQSGRFTTGNPGKPKGAMINASAKVKEAIFDFLEKNVDNIQESFDKLKPIEKLQFVANILPYALPKLSSIQSENNTKLSGGINIRWSEPRLLDSGDKGSNGELPSIQEGLPDNSESGGN
jgi:hypothetical protein